MRWRVVCDIWIPRSLVGGYGAIFLNSAIILPTSWRKLCLPSSSIISHPESPPKKPWIDLIEACFITGLYRTLWSLIGQDRIPASTLRSTCACCTGLPSYGFQGSGFYQKLSRNLTFFVWDWLVQHRCVSREKRFYSIRHGLLVP